MPVERNAVPVYTVVDVWRGMAAGAHSFRRLKDAVACMKRLRRGRNLQEDCVKIFVCYPIPKKAGIGPGRNAGESGAGWTSDRGDGLIEEIAP